MRRVIRCLSRKLETKNRYVVAEPIYLLGSWIKRDNVQNIWSTYLPFAEQGIPIVGLEPSCTLALRDEVPALLASAARTVAEHVLTFEELLARDKPELKLSKSGGQALLHGHCHQKALMW